jgi:tRNA (guanine37-N1)-methyltransferase
MLRVGFVTLFPDVVRTAMQESIIGRAADAGLVEFAYASPRDFAADKHRTVDDSPYGGEPGMLMKPETIALAVESLNFGQETEIIIPEPAAPLFKQSDANELSEVAEIIFICGHYEGIDARVAEYFRATSFSIGDFVVSGGELPAALMADAVIRRLPGTLGNSASLSADCFSSGLLSAPNYTRPEVWRGLKAPEVLLSGHHGEVAKWRRTESLKLSKKLRPNLLESADITAKEQIFLNEIDDE